MFTLMARARALPESTNNNYVYMVQGTPGLHTHQQAKKLVAEAQGTVRVAKIDRTTRRIVYMITVN